MGPAVLHPLLSPYLLVGQWSLAAPEDQQVQVVQFPRWYQLLQYHLKAVTKTTFSILTYALRSNVWAEKAYYTYDN